MSQASVFSLIDCNNFFVSCERLFRPDLHNKPVVVLSSNDGCVVSRSNEAKALKIPMGAPAFQYRDLFTYHKVAIFSANFELYGNISKRIIQLLMTITPRLEVYSVDESFLDIASLSIKDYEEWGSRVRTMVLRKIGIPVSIGIAPTKTLAKLASEIAKQDITSGGVVSMKDKATEAQERLLETVPIAEVWGVGRHLAPRLRAEGVHTALALARMRPQQAQQLMGIHGRQLVHELQGISCYNLEREHKPTKSIMRSRTFGEDTTEQYVLEAAVASLATNAAFALRQHNLMTRKIGIFMNTNRHKPGYESWEDASQLQTPTNDSGQIIQILIESLTHLYQPAQRYHRLGVFLYDLVPADSLQTDLLGFVDTVKHSRSTARMQAIDAINQQHGKGHIYYATEDLSKRWQPKHEIRSPRYVSNWEELPRARIV